MRLTGLFAVTGALVAALAALPLARLWAVATAYGDPASQQLAVALAVSGALILPALLALLSRQLLRPLGMLARALAARGREPLPLSTQLRDLRELAQAMPALAAKQGDTAALEEAVRQAREQLARQDAALQARMHYVQSLIYAIPVPVALHGADGRASLANRSWAAQADRAATHRSPIADSAAQPLGEVLTDLRRPAGFDEDLRRRLDSLAADARLALHGRLARGPRKALRRIAFAIERLRSEAG